MKYDDNPWTFNGVPFQTENIEKYEGFVYIITNLETGQQYLGRKYFFSIRKVKGKLRRQRIESNWKAYWGSSERVKFDLDNLGKKCFTRKIISLHITRGDCNYCEVKEQFQRNVLEDDTFYNDNISARWFTKPERIVEGRDYEKIK